MFNRFLGWLGPWLFKLGRLCLSKSRGHGRCWICSCNAGMGPIWGGGKGMTCNDCYDKWGEYQRMGMTVDWLGLGRYTRKQRREMEAFITDGAQP